MNLLAPRVSPLDIVRELSVRFEDRTKVAWTTLNITRLDDLERAKITFNIEAQSHKDVSQTISIMAQSGVFTNIKSGQVTSVEREKKPIFQAQITCNLSEDAIHQFAQTRDTDQSVSHKPRGSSQKNDVLEEKKAKK